MATRTDRPGWPEWLERQTCVVRRTGQSGYKDRLRWLEGQTCVVRRTGQSGYKDRQTGVARVVRETDLCG